MLREITSVASPLQLSGVYEFFTTRMHDRNKGKQRCLVSVSDNGISQTQLASLHEGKLYIIDTFLAFSIPSVCSISLPSCTRAHEPPADTSESPEPSHQASHWTGAVWGRKATSKNANVRVDAVKARPPELRERGNTSVVISEY